MIQKRVPLSEEDKAIAWEVRNESGFGIMDAKNALDEADWDKEKALLLLRQKGITSI